MRSSPDKIKKHMSIALRTALWSWLVTIVTLMIFVMVIIPEQKRAYIENLGSKAHGIAVALRDVAAGSAVSADFSYVVDHCMQIVRGDESIDYLVITRNDGFSLIHERKGWQMVEELPAEWRPVKRVPTSGIAVVSLFQRSIFQYSQPFDYSGIEWGWIHVGLSLDGYDRSVAAVYWHTCLLAVVFILLSFAASVFYARRLVRPIVSLQEVVCRIAGGNLSARASIEGGDELSSLALSVNTMTESLLRRDKSLQSVRFAAQRFLSTPEWEGVIDEVLEIIGAGAKVHRVCVLELHSDEDGSLFWSLHHEWTAEGTDPHVRDGDLQGGTWCGTVENHWAEALSRGETVVAYFSEVSRAEQDVLEARNIKSFAMAPINVDDSWWGCLNLADCEVERKWTEAELDSLRAIADMLGAAIGKQQTQEALLHAKEAAEAASRAKSQFLANMSHEIRTPMNGILGMIELLMHTRLNDQQLRYAQTARDSGDALLGIINDVLDLSKIEAGKIELEETAFEPHQVVKEVMGLLTGRAQQKGLSLTSLLALNVPRLVLGDPGRLRQILLNIVSNAVKFTERGEVSVRVFQVAAENESMLLRFEVQDTGIGIPADVQTHIFEPFTQADGSTTRMFGGTGLGLSITRQLVEMMGGEIGVNSVSGEGSTFWFTITARMADLPSHTLESPEYVPQNCRVLVIASSQTRLKLQQMLSLGGLVAETAENAWQALIMLRNATSHGIRYDTIILDTSISGQDLADLVGMVRTATSGPSPGIVYLTEKRMDADEEEMRRMGVDACLEEPIRPRQLLDCLAALRAAGRMEGGFKPVDVFAHKVEFGARVLVAEDNLVSQQVVASMLEILGCEVKMVSSGRDALLAWSEAPYDLVLMDCQMPVMDGFTATQRIREKEATGSVHTPVIALTAHAMEGDRDRCLAAGMDDYLCKPFSVEQLHRLLRQWIRKAPGAMEAGDSSVAEIPPFSGDGFQESLPKVTSSVAAQSAREEGTGERPPSRGFVLVVEDNLVNQQVVANMLELLGYQVELAPNGREALDRLRTCRYDLVLMDGQMPEMDGYQTTRALRELEASSPAQHRTPVVAITAHAARYDRQRCLAAGMDDYLTKPFNVKSLASILERWVPADEPSAHLPPDNQAKLSGAAAEPLPSSRAEDLGGPSTLPNPEAATYPVHLETKRVEQKSATSLPLVLVVDDEPTVLKLFSVFLENLGCEADLVSTGPEALESFMRRSYNLVFMDCNLPGMNGYQAVMEIRRLEASNPSKGRALIITMTGGNLEDWASRYPEADVDGHLPKPFEFNRLKEIVDHWLFRSPPASLFPAADGFSVASSGTTSESSGPVKEELRMISNEPPCLNLDTLNDLRALNLPGREDSFGKVVKTFLSESPTQLQGLRQAAESQETESVRLAAHSMKSSSAFLGAARLSSLCAAVEASARANSTDSLKGMISEVCTEFEKVREALLAQLP